jgi:RNA polymerase sigma-70 factor (ECF subfamily)
MYSSPGVMSLCRPVGRASAVSHDGDVSEDLRLAQSIARGDTDAFDVFYRRYVDRLYRMIYYQLGAQQADAEDVLQETMVAAVRALPDFRGQSLLFTWLCGIAQHKIADHRRRRGPAGEKVTVPLQDDDPPSSVATEGYVQNLETRLAVRQALDTLPSGHRQVLLLKYVQGLSVDEIAVATGRSFKSVESLLSRARESLRLALDNDMPRVTGAGSTAPR